MVINLIGDGDLKNMKYFFKKGTKLGNSTEIYLGMSKRLEHLLIGFGHFRFNIVEEQSESITTKLIDLF